MRTFRAILSAMKKSWFTPPESYMVVDLPREVEIALALPDPRMREEQIAGFGYVFEYAHRSWSGEEIGKAASLLLNAILAEEDKPLKDELIYILGVAVSYNDVHEYIDWDALISLLPTLTDGNLEGVLGMLGNSRKKECIAVLEPYLDDVDLEIQLTTLESIHQIWWNLSNNDPEVKAQLDIEENEKLSLLLINPPHESIESRPQKLKEYQEQFRKRIFKHREQTMKKLNAWFEHQKPQQ